MMKAECADFWAFTTIAAFPVGILIASSLGVSPFGAFLFGAYASFAALVANAISDGYLWMFAPHWKERFEAPDFSFKLAVISGAILLLVESVLLVMIFSDGGVDRTLLQLVYSRQCRANPNSDACVVIEDWLAQ